jgi:hypothetical protein
MAGSTIVKKVCSNATRKKANTYKKKPYAIVQSKIKPLKKNLSSTLLLNYLKIISELLQHRIYFECYLPVIFKVPKKSTKDIRVSKPEENVLSMLASINSNNDSISDSSNDSEVSTSTKKRGNFSLSSNNITEICKSFLSSAKPNKHRPTFNFNSENNLEK